MWVLDLFMGLQYLSVPVFLAWKFTLTTFLVWVGCFLFGYRVTYAQLWKWVMFSEIIFLIPEVLKIVWFKVFSTDPSFQDYNAFYPISLMGFFDHETLNSKFHYPLKALNLFEICYWYILAVGIFLLSNKDFKRSLIIVLSTYVPLFLIWLLFFIGVYK